MSGDPANEPTETNSIKGHYAGAFSKIRFREEDLRLTARVLIDPAVLPQGFDMTLKERFYKRQRDCLKGVQNKHRGGRGRSCFRQAMGRFIARVAHVSLYPVKRHWYQVVQLVECLPALQDHLRRYIGGLNGI
jgi:hypothetical protein